MKLNPPTGSKRGKDRCVADPKSVSVSDRVNMAYPGENFIPSNNKLFCSACREEIALKRVLLNYILRHKNTSAVKSELSKKRG